MTINFERPRPLPGSVTERWSTDRLWSERTVSEIISEAPWRDGTACVVDDVRYSFADMRDWAAVVAQALHAHGVRRADRVLIQLSNSAELIVSILASWQLGAIAVPVLPLFREHELCGVLRQVRPAVVIGAAVRGQHRPTADIDAALTALALTPHARLSVGAAPASWSAFPLSGREIQCADIPAMAGLPSAGACAAILFTSGTTADPKGVRHDSRSLIAEVLSYRRSADLTPQDVIFNPAPIAHVGALVVSALVPWYVGTPIVLQSDWNSELARHAIDREGVTFAVGAPFFLGELVAQYESPDFEGHRLTKFQTGAAPTSPELLVRADQVGISAWRAWGMTEAPTVSYGVVDDPLARRANWDGRIEPGSEVVAVDDRGEQVPHGGEGHLLLRSPKQMLGYIDPIVGAMNAEGWLSTGDLGIVDADGWVRITGRVKDIINRGGEKFSAREIENALCLHPAIAAAAVLGVPEPRLGEQVVAFVTIRPGQRDPGFAALIEHLAGLRMAPQKHPVIVTAIDALPVTATGKIHKPALADFFRTGQLESLRRS